MLLTWATALMLCAAVQGQDAGNGGFTTNFGGLTRSKQPTIPGHLQDFERSNSNMPDTFQ